MPTVVPVAPTTQATGVSPPSRTLASLPRDHPTRYVISLRDVLPKTWTQPGGRAAVGGVPLVDIAERFGTPCYVFDQAHIEHRLDEFSHALGGICTPVYASKAFLCTALAGLIASTDWWIDVVSDGEAAIARRGGIPPSRTLLHGNFKSPAEIELAASGAAGRTVVDSLDEIDDLEAAAREAGSTIDLMVRLNEHVDLVTDHKVLTTGEYAKFGLTPAAADDAIARIASSQRLRLVGMHLHAGSHITDAAIFGVILGRLADFVARHRSAFPARPVLLDLGGGIAAPYLRSDPVVSPRSVACAIRSALHSLAVEERIGPVRVLLEPGRSLVANAGLLLYSIGVRKPLPAGGKMLALDGGLTDNPRPALYDSRYELLPAEGLDRPSNHPFRVFGRMCETDVMLDTVLLPEGIGPGEVVVMPTAGAYTFSMSSRYNYLPRPPVLFVKDGQVREVVRRESKDDIARGQRTLDETASWSPKLDRSAT